MKIHIPKDLGDELPLLPDGSCTAVVKDVTGKKNSKTGNYQMYVKWILTSEMYDGEDKSSIGEPVLDQYVLVDQALWRLNDLYLAITGQSLNDLFKEYSGGSEEGDIDAEELVKLITEKIKGEEVHLLLEAETYEGKTRTKVKTVSKEGFGIEAEQRSDEVPF